MPHYSASDNNGAWETSPAQYVSAFNMAPGTCTAVAMGAESPGFGLRLHPGTVSIRGHALNASGQGGEMTLAVNLVSGRNVTQIWPSQGGRQLIAGTDQVGYATNVDNVQVAAGDSIRFEVHASGETVKRAVELDAIGWLCGGQDRWKQTAPEHDCSALTT